MIKDISGYKPEEAFRGYREKEKTYAFDYVLTFQIKKFIVVFQKMNLFFKKINIFWNQIFSNFYLLDIKGNIVFSGFEYCQIYFWVQSSRIKNKPKKIPNSI